MNLVLDRAAQNRAKFAIKSFTIANCKCRRMRSLMADARQDTLRNEEIKKKAGKADWLLESLDLLDNVVGLQQQRHTGKENIGGLISSLANDSISEETEEASDKISIEEQRAKVVAEVIDSTLRNGFPRHISELDGCHHLLIKYEPELDPTHPGFHDPEYRARRKAIAEIAFNYKYGEKIPDVEYEARELQTWAYIYERLKVAYGKYACERHNRALAELERECGYSPKSIPQLQKVSEYLESKTGWRIRPAAGLLSARDFLASLAFRVFQTTQYIRHWGNPEHSVEPDCIHELMGHIPMLCDPEFAQFSQEIGLASLGASDLEIERFATLYWFTVEFGLVRENDQLKCYGAGLLSSYGEMEHALESGLPQLRDFVAEETALVQYDDAEYQVVYYVAQSFEDAKEKIKQYAANHLDRDFELAYDPYTLSIRELNSFESIGKMAESIQGDMKRLLSAIGKMSLHQQQQHQHQQLGAKPEASRLNNNNKTNTHDNENSTVNYNSVDKIPRQATSFDLNNNNNATNCSAIATPFNLMNGFSSSVDNKFVDVNFLAEQKRSTIYHNINGTTTATSLDEENDEPEQEIINNDIGHRGWMRGDQHDCENGF